MTHIKSVNEMAMKGTRIALKDDYRICLVPISNSEVDMFMESGATIDDMPDDMFVRIAEEEGLVYTLEGFQNGWNNDTDFYVDSDNTYMRIFPTKQFRNYDL